MVIAIAGLHGPAYRYTTNSKQMVKGGYQPVFPSVGQMRNSLALQVCQPMAHTGWRQRRREPVACCYTVGKQDADCFFAAADAVEMGVRTGGHNATTQGAAVALHVQAVYKSIKISRDEAVSPNLAMVAVQADSRLYPRKVLTLLKNVLEKNCNKIYHEVTFVVWGIHPKM